MNICEGCRVRILVDYRNHKSGHIGLVEKMISNRIAKVNLNWEDDSKPRHIIFIHDDSMGEMWEPID